MPLPQAATMSTQPAVPTEIERLRERRPSRSDGVPAQQRATAASLRQRLETLCAENQRLREENAGLKTELAIAYGQQPLRGASLRRSGPAPGAEASTAAVRREKR
jgi:hypothetical protein